MKKALITGACGQDGSYLAEHLLGLGYEVHGIARGLSYQNHVEGVVMHVGDMRDKIVLENIFLKVWPDELYNLAGQVFVPTSWTYPEETFNVNVCGLSRLLEIVQRMKVNTRVYQASSSEMFGNVGGVLNETSPMNPVSPYGVSKLAAHQLVQVYRHRGLFVVSGILFNHESPRRGEHMVTRKISKHVAKWAMGDKSPLELGNREAVRDWGHAKDYVRAMHLMLQEKMADDFVIGTGHTNTVEEFLRAAVMAAGLYWHDVEKLVEFRAEPFLRKNDITSLKADSNKANIILGWKPSVTFRDLVTEMVHHDWAIERKRANVEAGV